MNFILQTKNLYHNKVELLFSANFLYISYVNLINFAIFFRNHNVDVNFNIDVFNKTSEVEFINKIREGFIKSCLLGKSDYYFK